MGTVRQLAADQHKPITHSLVAVEPGVMMLTIVRP